MAEPGQQAQEPQQLASQQRGHVTGQNWRYHTVEQLLCTLSQPALELLPQALPKMTINLQDLSTQLRQPQQSCDGTASLDERSVVQHAECPTCTISCGTVLQDHTEVIHHVALNGTHVIPIQTGTRNREIYLVHEPQQGAQKADKHLPKDKLDAETKHRMKKMTNKQFLEQACTVKSGYRVLDMLVDVHGSEEKSW